MKKTMLGKTGILVSTLGLGTTKFGRNQAVKYPDRFELPSDRTLIDLLQTANAAGINVIDTAPAYGSSEERLGKLLRNRADWVIVTKVGEEFEHGKSSFNFTPEHAQFSIERSLKRLNTDYLDVVMVHSDGNDVYNLSQFGILEYLADLKQKGLIRAFGASTKTLEGGIFAAKHAEVVMVTHNPAYTEELPVIEEAYQNQKGVLIKKALMSGHIQNLPGEDPVNNAINFINQVAGVSSIIIGTVNVLHLAHAIQCT